MWLAVCCSGGRGCGVTVCCSGERRCGVGVCYGRGRRWGVVPVVVGERGVALRFTIVGEKVWRCGLLWWGKRV